MNEASGGSNQQPSFWFGPRKVTYAPQPVHGLVDKSLARKAVKDALNSFRVDKAQDVKLYEEVEANLMIAMSCSNLLVEWNYLMVSWGCEPAFATAWLRGASWENWCKRACSWLLEVAYPFNPTDRGYYGPSCLDAMVEHQSQQHQAWQDRRIQLEVEHQHAIRMVLKPPFDPDEAVSWRRLALWRAQKLGLAGVRHRHGLLLGSIKEAAAKITMMEFGLDPEKGGHNSVLFKQLLSICTEGSQWQEFMEMSASIEMITDGVLNKAPKDIPWLTRRMLVDELASYRDRGDDHFDNFFDETTIRQKNGDLVFTREGDFDSALFQVYYAAGQLICIRDQPYEHRNHDD